MAGEVSDVPFPVARRGLRQPSSSSTVRSVHADEHRNRPPPPPRGHDSLAAGLHVSHGRLELCSLSSVFLPAVGPATPPSRGRTPSLPGRGRRERGRRRWQRPPPRVSASLRRAHRVLVVSAGREEALHGPRKLTGLRLRRKSSPPPPHELVSLESFPRCLLFRTGLLFCHQPAFCFCFCVCEKKLCLAFALRVAFKVLMFDLVFEIMFRVPSLLFYHKLICSFVFILLCFARLMS